MGKRVQSSPNAYFKHVRPNFSPQYPLLFVSFFFTFLCNSSLFSDFLRIYISFHNKFSIIEVYSADSIEETMEEDLEECRVIPSLKTIQVYHNFKL